MYPDVLGLPEPVQTGRRGRPACSWCLPFQERERHRRGLLKWFFRKFDGSTAGGLISPSLREGRASARGGRFIASSVASHGRFSVQSRREL